MKKITVMITLLIALVLAGCIPARSIYPIYLYTDEDVIFDLAILGVWLDRTDNETWEFTQMDETTYGLRFTDEGIEGCFYVKLVELGEFHFLDIYPDPYYGDGCVINTLQGVTFLPAHVIVLVRETEPELKLSGMDEGWLHEYLEKNPEAITHQIWDIDYEGQVILTARTEELQDFFVEHAGNEEAFDVNETLVRLETGSVVDTEDAEAEED